MVFFQLLFLISAGTQFSIIQNMPDPDFFDFMKEAGDELLSIEPRPHCGEGVRIG
jgi:hypothetical protein